MNWAAAAVIIGIWILLAAMVILIIARTVRG